MRGGQCGRTQTGNAQVSVRHKGITSSKKLLGAKGITTRNKNATRNKCIATSNKCLTTRNKNATRNKCIATSNKCLTTSSKKLKELRSFAELCGASGSRFRSAAGSMLMAMASTLRASLLLVVRPGARSSVLATSSKARSP